MTAFHILKKQVNKESKMLKKLLLVSMTCMLAINPGAYAKEKRATIEKAVNYVQVNNGATALQVAMGVKKWVTAAEGSPVYVGSSIRTGIRSVAELRYDDGTLTRIGSRTNMVISDRKLTIKRGYIWGKVDKTKTRGLKIYSPNAVASIVGTEFFVEVNRENNTMITVLEGSIEVNGTRGKTIVTAGTYSVVDEKGNVSDPASFNTDEVVERYQEVVKM
jgi:ferric-dicitrate binding protein FerR (iron transport regulator)